MNSLILSVTDLLVSALALANTMRDSGDNTQHPFKHQEAYVLYHN